LKLAFDEVISQGYFYNELITRKVLKGVGKLVDTKNPMSVFVKLTEREIEFLKYACTEMTYKEIADKMFVSVRTVESYRNALCEKLDLKSPIGLAIYTVKNRVVKLFFFVIALEQVFIPLTVKHFRLRNYPQIE
jgi:DNA-binding NarL/FixJ family response regulator